MFNKISKKDKKELLFLIVMFIAFMIMSANYLYRHYQPLYIFVYCIASIFTLFVSYFIFVKKIFKSSFIKFILLPPGNFLLIVFINKQVAVVFVLGSILSIIVFYIVSIIIKEYGSVATLNKTRNLRSDDESNPKQNSSL